MLEILKVNATILRTTVQNFFCSLRSQIIRTSTFKFISAALFAFIV